MDVDLGSGTYWALSLSFPSYPRLHPTFLTTLPRSWGRFYSTHETFKGERKKIEMIFKYVKRHSTTIQEGDESQKHKVGRKAQRDPTQTEAKAGKNR